MKVMQIATKLKHLLSLIFVCDGILQILDNFCTMIGDGEYHSNIMIGALLSCNVTKCQQLKLDKFEKLLWAANATSFLVACNSQTSILNL